MGNIEKEIYANKSAYKDKERFKSVINLINSDKEDPILKNYSRYSNTEDLDEGRYQYSGRIYWVGYKFTDDQKERLTVKYKDAYGFFIMPYCITEEIITSESLENSKKEEKHILNHKGKGFNEIDRSENPIDWDGSAKNSGFNFHRDSPEKETRYQILIVKKETSPKGPGAKCSIDNFDFIETPNKNERLNYVKTDWYFPNIMSEKKIELSCKENDLKDWLVKDLKNMEDTIFKKI